MDTFALSFDLLDMHPAPTTTRDRGIVAIEHGHRLLAFDVEVFADGVISLVCECDAGLGASKAREVFTAQLAKGHLTFTAGGSMGRRITKNLRSGDYCWR